MQVNVKIKNGKELQLKTLVNSGCTHMGIDKQLVKEEKIKTKPLDFSFEVFNTNGTKNEEVTRIAPLKVKINGYKEQINGAVTDLNRIDIFIEHDWLVKHNPKVNWKEDKIKFTRCLKTCRTSYQDIIFKTRRV